ncbi:MAG: discoidin domain-containing protein, partial [Patescibacteria group bacterium]|nr:discoidin domain-containing protein [Patescibacteria group bacterium]
MPKNILKYLGGVALALGLSFAFFAQPAKAMPGSLTQWLDACTMPGSCSTWTYGSTNGLSVPQGGWLQIRMHNRWVTSPGQLPLYQDGFTVSDIIMDWGYTCPTGLTCYMLPYYASGVTPWTVNGKNYNYLAWDSVSNQDYSPVVTFNTSAATPPGTYRVYFTVFENPSMVAPAAIPPNSGCQFPAPGCLGPVENYVDITVTSPSTNGVCGTANNKTYPSGSTAYSPDTQCAAGVSDNTAFPAAGASVSWVCKGTGGGSDSPTCRASQAPPAQCVNITAPDTVTVGQTFSASVTMKNTNNTTWWNNTEAAFKNSVAWYFPNDPYRLGSWTPTDNNRWGLTRVDMPMSSIGTSGRYLRARTPSSNSWVAWREITLYDAAGNRVTPVNATVSSDWRGANYAIGPTGAYDGQGWTVWNSGTYNGTITLDYGRVVDFASLWILPEQTPNPPNTTYYFEVSNDNINYTQIAAINAQTQRSDVWYIINSYAKNNNNITYNFSATAPTTPGTYAFNWNMVHEGVAWFPDASA